MFLVAPLVVLVLGDRRALRRESAELVRLTREDWRWLTTLPALLLGILLWLERRAALLPALRWFHDAFTYVLGFLVAGHIALATLHPRTRPALRGMLDGRVPAEWAARHYPRWMPEAEAGPTGSGGVAGTPA